jgi:hypothetical protein
MIAARDGTFARLPEGLPSERLVTFSPDERWVALATRDGVYLVATPLNDEPGTRFVLPFAANDAAWEPVTPGT